MIKIERASNGFILTDTREDFVQSIYSDDLQGIQLMLCDIIDLIGASGSRYDKERLYIAVKPGDKHNESNG